LFGTNMTATVTIDGDTTDTSGKYTWSPLSGGTISFVQITSGTYSVTGAGVAAGASYIVLDHGAISQWSLVSFFGAFSCGSGPGYVVPCVMQTVDVTAPATSAEFIVQVCQLCGPTSVKGDNQFARPSVSGTWSIVAPVPAPVLGSGISGLALLISFFISRSATLSRRTRQGRYSIRRRSALMLTMRS
jgi:hypothetical protein